MLPNDLAMGSAVFIYKTSIKHWPREPFLDLLLSQTNIKIASGIQHQNLDKTTKPALPIACVVHWLFSKVQTYQIGIIYCLQTLKCKIHLALL